MTWHKKTVRVVGLALAALLLSRFDVVLLDEPTNDLDLDTLRLLEDFLDEWPGALIVVSHDRALLERADLVLSPDSGPVHMANAMGTPVIGLFACTDRERCGPYSDLRWSVNHYDEASRRFMHRPASELPWGKRVEFAGVMDLVGVDEVIGRFEAFRATRSGPGQPAL